MTKTNSSNNNNEQEEDDSSEFRKYFQQKNSEFIRKRVEKKTIDHNDNNSVLGVASNNNNVGDEEMGNNDDNNNITDNNQSTTVFEQYKTILELHGKSSSKNTMTFGHWDSTVGKFEVSIRKGKQYDSVGQQVGSKLYLNIEEAIYLQDLGILELNMNQLPLSVQESFKLFQVSQFPIYKYNAYSYLKKLGYILIRHDQNINNTPTTTTTTTTTTSPIKNQVLSNFNFKILPESELTKLVKFNKNNNNNNNNNNNINDNNNSSNNNKPQSILSLSIDNDKFIKYRNFIPDVSNVYTDLIGFEPFQIIEKGEYKKPTYTIDRIKDQFLLSQITNKDQLIKSVLNSNKSISDKYNIVDVDTNTINDDTTNTTTTTTTTTIPNKRIKLNNQSLLNLPFEMYQDSQINSINRRIQIFKVISLLGDKEYHNQPKPTSTTVEQIKIDYDVYKPNQSFKKKNPGIPDFYLSISKSGTQIPTMNDISRLKSTNPLVPLQFCVVNIKDISFIEFNENLVLSSAL